MKIWIFLSASEMYSHMTSRVNKNVCMYVNLNEALGSLSGNEKIPLTTH